MDPTESLAKTLDSLPDDFNFEDPKALAQVMGEGDPNDEAAAAAGQGDTTATQVTEAATAPAAAPAAAPAPAAASAPAPAVESSAAPAAAAPAADVKVEGVLAKDGKHVLPYSALQESRRDALLNKRRADELEEANQRLQAQIESLKSGKPIDGAPVMSEEEMAQLEKDFPQLAPLMKSTRALQATVTKLTEQQRQPAGDKNAEIDAQLDAQAELDAAMAQRPLLSRYADQGGVVWQRAIEIDRGLLGDETWASKPIAERFKETERLLAQELGVQLPASTPAPPPAPAGAPAAAPAPRADLAAAAPAAGPSTLTDISGTAPRLEKDPWDDRLPIEGLAAAERMTDEQVMRSVGIHY